MGRVISADVNTIVSKRIEGSSILVPYLNNKAVSEVYSVYTNLMNALKSENALTDEELREYKSLNVNIFDMVYGNYIYEGSEMDLNLPHYFVDMTDNDIEILDENDRLMTVNDQYVDDIYNPYPIYDELYPKTYGVTLDGCAAYVGDTYLYTSNGKYTDPSISVIGAINQYTGAVTAVTYPNIIANKIIVNSIDGSMNPSTENTQQSYKPIAYIPDAGITTDNLDGQSHSMDYELLKSEPDDWAVNYASYYIYKNEKYVAVTGVTNPTWIINTYYTQTGEDTYELQSTEPKDWETNYGTYYIRSGEEEPYQYIPVASTTVHAPKFVADKFYSATGHDVDHVDKLNSSVVLARLIKNGVIPTGESVAIVVGIIDGNNVVSFTFIPIYVDPVSKLVKHAVFPDKSKNALAFIDYSSAAGSGNIIATVSSDKAYLRVGSTVIKLPSNRLEKDVPALVYVNGYDVSTRQTSGAGFDTGRVRVYNNTDKLGNTPNYVSIPNKNILMGHEYDVLAYSSNIDSVKLAVRSATVAIPHLSNYTSKYGSKFTPGSVVSGLTEDAVLTLKGVGSGATSVANFKIASMSSEGTVTAIEFVDGKFIYKPDDTVSPTQFDDIDDANLVAIIGGNETVVGTVTLKIQDLRPLSISDSVDPSGIYRYTVTGSIGSLHQVQISNTSIPYFDDADMNSIEFKWRYSELLVKAFRGEIDPRIMSPTRCPAKYLFDMGTNTIVGQTILTNVQYRPIDIINASTIFTEDEKDAVLYDESIVTSFIDTYDATVDIDVKQAMYDLMVYRCYYGMPEDKRPIGPGYGLSLHLDAGVTDATTAMLINDSFKRRFQNPNASWDIGGYTSATNGITYTYAAMLAKNLVKHCKSTSVNKPYAMTYAQIPPTDYTSFYPDIDTTDWELRELLYNSGGNAWIPDINGNLVRRSQRTLKIDEDTSDLIQESNMRTLSQLCYLLQNKIDSSLLEYNDDGVLKTLTDQVNNMFSNWVGNLVQALDISFERDTNPLDGGDIVVCYCNVTFRGLILRVPIIVNVQRRQG